MSRPLSIARRPLLAFAAPVLALALALPSHAAESVPAPEATPEVTLESLQAQIRAQQAQLDALAAQRDDAADGKSRTTIGGYGELHYNALDSQKEIDFHRFVLFIGHEFNDRIRLFSEVELEHSIAGEGQNGEIELEQAYIEFLAGESTKVRAGLFLLPIGYLNETHEPTTFYGVERNPIEHDIIPSTWWEAGVMVSGELGGDGLTYDVGLHSGLNVDNTFDLRDGRQKVSEAVADELAVSARLRWQRGGLELAGAVFHQGDVSQGLVPGAGAGTLFEGHAGYQTGPWSVRVLGAQWRLDGAAPAALEKDVQTGGYAEGAYRVREDLGFFVRYSEWDNGGVGATAQGQINAGFNWWLHPDVVIKMDIQDQRLAVDDDGFNLGIGFRF